jgi:hypothetical protein
MPLTSIVMIAAGIIAIIVGALQARGPLARIRQLDATAANLERYETWRGKNTGVDADGPTGADIMRQQMRQRVLVWAGVAIVGIALVVIGLIVA